ncbi:MAG: 50S ribosomal protein L31e [Thermoplasmata archaeon]|nr:50S ribosomal protein L31e [Thermoplasmata archaeon]|tara:strand:+ start:192 stop:482 length:291 start_codon:yes stop_codon:yes gene_type:complete
MADSKLFYGTRHYTVPLRAAWACQRTKRAKRAVEVVKKFVTRHMKVQDEENIWIDQDVNEVIWARGIQKPPRRIHIIVNREDGDDRIEVQLDEAKY